MAKKKVKKKKTERKSFSIDEIETLWMQFHDAWLSEQTLPEEFKHVPAVIEALVEWAVHADSLSGEARSLQSDAESLAWGLEDIASLSDKVSVEVESKGEENGT